MNRENDRIACACCGFKTITESWDICPICKWECVPALEREPDFPVSANRGITLREAQRNFLKWGNCDGRPKAYLGPRLSKFERDPEWRPFPAVPDPVEDGKAWRRTIVRLLMDCPCCGYNTHVSTGHECRICRYFFDYRLSLDVDRRNPKTNRGLSLRECQQNYLRCGAYSPEVAHLRTEPGPTDERGPHWKPLPPRGPNR
jgi:hypothetical protein